MRCASRWRATSRPGHDIRLGPQDVENNRNFATKLWNAARFVEFNGAARVEGFDPKSAKETLNRWIAHETAKAAAEITRRSKTMLQRGRRRGLSLRLERLLRLVCRAVEAAADRPRRPGQGRDARDGGLGARRNPQAAASLHAVHHRGAVGGDGRAGAEARRVCSRSATGRSSTGLADDKAEAEIGWVIDLVTAIRSVRAEMNITAAIPLVLAGASAETKARAERWAEFIKRLARVSEISSAERRPARLGAARRARRGGGAAAQGRHRSCRRARAARQGNAEGRGRHRARRCQAQQSEVHGSARRKRWSRRKRKSARRRSRRKAKIAEALERLKGAV